MQTVKTPRDNDPVRSDGMIITNGQIDMQRLAAIASRPKPFAGSQRSFWTDPYVSKHLLNAHLDPDRDEATRRPEFVERTVNAIAGRFDRPQRLLDLACGPGIYAQEFAHLGWDVVGIDFSENSIDYATRQSRKGKLDVSYVCGDLRRVDFGGPYDVVTLIYGEFCAFRAKDQARILTKIASALRDGGLFVFDVFTQTYAERYHSNGEWYVGARDGFWQKEKHLVLEQSFHYPEESASVRRYTIVRADGSYRQYCVWWHYSSLKSITELLRRAGFEVTEAFDNLWEDPLSDEGEWIGLYCKRQ